MPRCDWNAHTYNLGLDHHQGGYKMRDPMSSYASMPLLLILIVPFAALLSQTIGSLRVVVRPEARMTIAPVDHLASGAERTRWFQIDFTIRMYPGTTASLFAEPVRVNRRVEFLVKQGGESSPRTIERGVPLLTIQQNGNHSLQVGIVAQESGERNEVAPTVRFVLESSDDSLILNKTVPL